MKSQHHTKKYYYTFKTISLVIYSVIAIFFALLTGCKKTDNLSTDIISQKKTLSTAAGKTNIILMLGDDIGYEIPTCDGGQSYSTPRLDEMAAEGMRFTQCYASPLCSPSRIMLLTGKYSFRNYNQW